MVARTVVTCSDALAAMSLRCIAFVGLLAACGRVGFEQGDASTCVAGDGLCTVECVGVDPDCVTTCGDGRCVGNAKELCSVCAADCATLDPVCGNGACDPGERAAHCVADCGPDPWPWSGDEDQLVALINQTRTAGFQCASMVETAPELAIDATMQPSAREWAWELAHQQFFDPSGGACNGRSLADREAAAGFAGYLSASGYTTVQDVLAAWLADPAQCAIVMSPVPTQIFVAIGRDVDAAYIIELR